MGIAHLRCHAAATMAITIAQATCHSPDGHHAAGAARHQIACAATITRLSPKGFGYHFNFELPMEPIPLSRLRTAANLVMMVDEHARNPATIRISASDAPEEPDPTFNGKRQTSLRQRRLSPRPSSTFQPSGTSPLPPEQVQRARLLDKFLRICNAFHVSDESQVMAGDLADQEESINALAAALNKRTGDLRAPYTQLLPVGATFGVVADIVVHLVDISLIAILGAMGQVTAAEKHPEEERYRTTVGRAKAQIDRYVIPKAELAAFDVDAAHSKMLGTLREKGCLHVTNFTVATSRTASGASE